MWAKKLRAISRYGLGILCGAFFVSFSLSVFYLIKPDAEITRPLAVVMVIIGAGFGVATFCLLKKPVLANLKPCPNCGSFRTTKLARVRRRRNWIELFFLGTLGVLRSVFEALRQSRRKREVCCDECGTFYSSKTLNSQISAIIVWIFIVLWGFGILMAIFEKGQNSP
jgi:hypothetical protein